MVGKIAHQISIFKSPSTSTFASSSGCDSPVIPEKPDVDALPAHLTNLMLMPFLLYLINLMLMPSLLRLLAVMLVLLH